MTFEVRFGADQQWSRWHGGVPRALLEVFEMQQASRAVRT
jgi:hypothetical protein